MGVSHLILIGALAVAAGQGLDSQAKPQLAAEPGSEQAAPGKNPYLRIFQGKPAEPPAKLLFVPVPQRLNAAKEAQPRVVCGLVVIPVTPAADAKMIVQPKQDPKPDFKIRTIAPRICNE
jgi:hypothetical protein